MAKNRFSIVLTKITLAAAPLIMFGLPILETWKMVIVLASWLALVYCDVRLEKWRILAAIGIILVVPYSRSLLPRANIEEGHNIFLCTQENGVLQRDLPVEISEEWRRAYNEQYPPGQLPLERWRKLKAFPTMLYAYSCDALWRAAKYSRQVDGFSFRNLSQFRGGFANDMRYNFYGSDPVSFARNFQVQLPFFVMYEWSPQSAGCTLFWQGTVFWQKDDGSYEKINHTDFSGRTIASGDAGKRVYALNLPAVFPGGFKERSESRNTPRILRPYELSMRLNLSPKLAFGRLAGDILSLTGVLVLIVLMMRIKWKDYCIAMCITALSLVIIFAVIHYSSGKFLGHEYPPQGGGDDGIFHESYGRDIAYAAMNGNFGKAFEGGEPVYWFTPGMRYARAVEKIIFGDTNLGYALFVALLPWIVYLLTKHLAGFRWGMISSLLFLFLPLGSFSFLQYVRNAKLGYSEAMGFGLFILGIYLFIRCQPRWGGHRDGLLVFAGGLCLTASVFLRPNFAIAVLLLGLFFLLPVGAAVTFLS